MSKSKSNKLNIFSLKQQQFKPRKSSKKLIPLKKNINATFGKTARKTEIQEIIERYQYKDLPDLDMERAYKYRYDQSKCVVDLSTKAKTFSRLKNRGKNNSISSTRRLENFINMHDNKDESKFNSKYPNDGDISFKTPYNI